MSTNRLEPLKNLSPQKRALLLLLLKALGREAVQAEQSKRIPKRSQQNTAPFLLPSNGCGFSIDCLPKTLPTAFLLLCGCKGN